MTPWPNAARQVPASGAGGITPQLDEAKAESFSEWRGLPLMRFWFTGEFGPKRRFCCDRAPTAAGNDVDSGTAGGFTVTSGSVDGAGTACSGSRPKLAFCGVPT